MAGSFRAVPVSTGGGGGGITVGDKGQIIVNPDGSWTIDPADAAAIRTALGLDTAAQQPSGSFQLVSAKGAANGYAGLDGSALLPTIIIPNADLLPGFAEAVDDRVAALLAGSGILTVSYNDAGNVLTLTVPSSVGDPWTVVRLLTDVSNSAVTAIDVPGLAFTPGSNKRYEFNGRLRLRTAAATTGAQPGLAWPTAGVVDGTGEVWAPNSATATAMAFGNANAALKAAATGLPNTTQSWPASIAGEIETGNNPSGSVRVQLASEVAASAVTIKAGSFIRYREIA